MPRYGNRWRWSPMELQSAVKYLRTHNGHGGLIHMPDIERAALSICGKVSAARVLRDRLVAADCLTVDTARGRAAAYALTPDAETCIAIAEDTNQRGSIRIMVLAGLVLRSVLESI